MNSDVIKSKIQDKLSEIQDLEDSIIVLKGISLDTIAVSYTHLRAHET